MSLFKKLSTKREKQRRHGKMNRLSLDPLHPSVSEPSCLFTLRTYVSLCATLDTRARTETQDTDVYSHIYMD